jgi:hypothetical protein
MADSRRLQGKPRSKSNNESSLIKLKAAFKTGSKGKTVRARVSGRKVERRRTVRFEYQSGLADVKDISRNLDSVTVLIDKLHNKATPTPFQHSIQPDPVSRAPVASRRKTKSPHDTLNTSVASLLSSTAESLYRRRWEGSPIPVVKETKPKLVQKTRQLIRESLPLLRM